MAICVGQGIKGYAESLLVMEQFGYPDFLTSFADDTPRRIFARVQPTTKDRIDVGLRLEGQEPLGRLRLSTIHEAMKLQVSFNSVEEIDEELLSWRRRAYDENC